MNSDLFQSLHIKTIVTAVKWLNNTTILTGIGGHLAVFKKNLYGRWTSLINQRIFPSQNIYGFVLKGLKEVAIYGGRLYCITDLTDYEKTVQLNGICECEDWILDAVWLRDPSGLCLLTAHAKLVLVDSVSGTVIRTAICPERSILYSARIVYDRWDELILFGGTVYNDILVWTLTDTSDERNTLGNIIATLKGHKGVIFSVGYDEETQRICSTSDDRSARVWQVVFREKEKEGEDKEKMRSVKWLNAEVNLKLTLFGHKARVWDSYFLPESFIATIGEVQ